MTYAEYERGISLLLAVFPHPPILTVTLAAWFDLLRDLDGNSFVEAARIYCQSERSSQGAVAKLRELSRELRTQPPPYRPKLPSPEETPEQQAEVRRLLEELNAKLSTPLGMIGKAQHSGREPMMGESEAQL